MFVFFTVPAILILIAMGLPTPISNHFAFYLFTSTFAYFLLFMFSHKDKPFLKEFFECKEKVYVKPEKILKKEVPKNGTRN